MVVATPAGEAQVKPAIAVVARLAAVQGTVEDTGAAAPAASVPGSNNMAAATTAAVFQHSPAIVEQHPARIAIRKVQEPIECSARQLWCPD